MLVLQTADLFLTSYYVKPVSLSTSADANDFVVKTWKTFLGVYIDRTSYPFVDDPDVIGKWVSVDFVEEPEKFVPAQKQWKRDLWLKEIQFFKGGTTRFGFQWTKGLVLNQPHHTASRYRIKNIDGTEYMFLEHKSGDYTILHRKPYWYVLVKADDKNSSNNASLHLK